MLLNQCVNLLLTPQPLPSLFLLPAPVSPLCVITPYSWLLSPILPPPVTEYCLSDTIQLCRLLGFFLRSTSVHLHLRKQLAKHSGHKAARHWSQMCLVSLRLTVTKHETLSVTHIIELTCTRYSSCYKKLQGPRASSSMNIVWHNASNASPL